MRASLVLDLRDVERRRGAGQETFTLRIPAFTLHRGECLALTGPSGSGKSTLLDVLGLVLRPDRAQAFQFVTRRGQALDVAALWQRGQCAALARMRMSDIGYALQTGGLLPFLSAGENVELPRKLQAMARDGLVEHLLERLRIAHLRNKRPQALSIGERQRFAIARAFAHCPLLVLADEPTAALDPPHAVQVTRLMLELAAELESAMLIVTHNWELLKSLALREVQARLDVVEGGSVTYFEHVSRSPHGARESSAGAA